MNPSDPASAPVPPYLVPAAALEALRAGRQFELWKHLGAHPEERSGLPGARFAVWAPRAAQVWVTGDFNEWSRDAHPLRPRGRSGVWETFVPGVKRGAVYKYRVDTRLGGRTQLKSDPVAFRAEGRPNTGSVVEGLQSFAWTDADWLAGRAAHQAPDRPLNIYEVHLGSWRHRETSAGAPAKAARTKDDTAAPPWLTYRELAEELVAYVREMGYTHIELLPVTEHPFDGSWGYQTTGYFAPTARFGPPDGLRALVDTAHTAGIGVLLDWAPAHFPRDAHGLGFFDGTPTYEHADPRRGQHPDWGTYIFDFGKPEIVSFLVSSALFWIEEFHMDGIRVDAVASMLYLDYSREKGAWAPNAKGGRENLEAVELLRTLNREVHARHPGALVMAEESTSWPGVTAPVEDGGLGFDLKWNMGWMNDTLAYFGTDPLGRKGMHDKLTFSLMYAFSERFLLPFSHDEVVHLKASLISKMPGTRGERFGNVRAMLGYQMAHPGKKLLFMGAELGQWSEWNHDEQLEWTLLDHAPHRALRRWVRALNRFYVERPELWEVDGNWEGFEWIDHGDAARSVLVFVRRGRDPGRFLLVVANFTPVSWKDLRVGVPPARAYRPVLSSDEERFGGGGAAAPRRVPVENERSHDREGSIVLTVPPLSVTFFEPVEPGAPGAARKVAAKPEALAGPAPKPAPKPAAAPPRTPPVTAPRDPD